MTDGQKMLYEMIRRGPYRGSDDQGGTICGFCGGDPGRHIGTCPWPRFLEGNLTVWPEWIPDLNSADQQVRFDAEREAGQEWRDV